MSKTESRTNRELKPVGVNLDPATYKVVKEMAVAEDRPVGYIIRRLLKTHPRIQPILEAGQETAAASS